MIILEGADIREIGDSTVQITVSRRFWNRFQNEINYQGIAYANLKGIVSRYLENLQYMAEALDREYMENLERGKKGE